LSFSFTPDGQEQDLGLVYDPVKVWSVEDEPVAPIPGFPAPPSAPILSSGPFAGYNFVKTTYVDSAAAGTQIASGVKSFNNAINWTNEPAGVGTSLEPNTLPEIAKLRGKATGVVSSVYFSHATPATIGGAHNISRNNLAAIANEMLSSDTLDVILGAGHPEFNNAGQPVPYAPANANLIGGDATWQALVAGSHPGGWTLVTERADFEAIAEGLAEPPARFLGIAQVRDTLQYNRPFTTDWDGNGVLDNAFPHPFFPANSAQLAERQAAAINPGDDSAGEPFVANVPSLETMTKAAIRALDAAGRDTGFFLMVEGAHIDWASHAQDFVRMVEEQADFNRSVEAAISWVEVNSNWEETLIIVLADHECGVIWGPDSDTVPFQPIVDNGIGALPGMRGNSYMHTNHLVPVFARGAGAELLAKHVDGVDPFYRARHGLDTLPGWGDEYIDLTAVFAVVKESMAVGADCPADLNLDGMVGPSDLGILLGAWGGSGAADLTGDGVVDNADIAVLLGAWGTCPR
jgi:alkaline phosphatase